jgi:hypothetical protein
MAPGHARTDFPSQYTKKPCTRNQLTYLLYTQAKLPHENRMMKDLFKRSSTREALITDMELNLDLFGSAYDWTQPE